MVEKILKKIQENAPLILIVFGVLFIGISSTHWYFKLKSLSLNAEIVSKYTNQTNNDQLTPKHIEIKWFIDTDIEQQVFSDNNWTISENQASYLINSAKPGENGNIIIYGHNTRSILGNIRALKGDEIIRVTTQDNTQHLYAIDVIEEVEPENTKYLLPTKSETLTIYTCSGFLDKKRFIVQAKPI